MDPATLALYPLLMAVPVAIAGGLYRSYRRQELRDWALFKQELRTRLSRSGVAPATRDSLESPPSRRDPEHEPGSEAPSPQTLPHRLRFAPRPTYTPCG